MIYITIAERQVEEASGGRFRSQTLNVVIDSFYPFMYVEI